jgi:hypothetical protein
MTHQNTLSPWNNDRSHGQEILRLLWNPEVNYHVHKIPTLMRVNSVHTVQTYFIKIHFNANLPFMPRSPKWLLDSGFPNQNFVRISHLPNRVASPVHFILIDLYYPNII